MYIKTVCPCCGDVVYHDLEITRAEYFECGCRKDEITQIDIVDSCGREEFVQSVLMSLSGFVYDGISKKELCKILQTKIGLLEQYCADAITRLKLEMEMYSPDSKHLYFIPEVRLK